MPCRTRPLGSKEALRAAGPRALATAAGAWFKVCHRDDLHRLISTEACQLREGGDALGGWVAAEAPMHVPMQSNGGARKRAGARVGSLVVSGFSHHTALYSVFIAAAPSSLGRFFLRKGV